MEGKKLRSEVFLETWINIVPFLNYPILAFRCPNIFPSLVREQIFYRIEYTSVLKKITKRRKEIYESRYTLEEKEAGR